MKGPHHSGECRQESRCQKCGKKHHSLLHFERSQAHHAMGARPRQEGSQPSEPSREPENGPVVAAATSQPVGATPILQCCLAWALSPDGGIKKLARVFFDSGSELAMVRRDLANKLGLDGPCHRLTLTGVGGVNLPSTMEKRVKFQLQDLSGTYTSHPIEAVTKEKLTEKMREIRVNPSDFASPASAVQTCWNSVLIRIVKGASRPRGSKILALSSKKLRFVSRRFSDRSSLMLIISWSVPGTVAGACKLSR